MEVNPSDIGVARLTDVNQVDTVADMRDRHIPDLVSLPKAAKMLGISKAAAHKRAVKEQLPGARLDDGEGTWVFRRAVIERMAAAEKEARDEQ